MLHDDGDPAGQSRRVRRADFPLPPPPRPLSRTFSERSDSPSLYSHFSPSHRGQNTPAIPAVPAFHPSHLRNHDNYCYDQRSFVSSAYDGVQDEDDFEVVGVVRGHDDTQSLHASALDDDGGSAAGDDILDDEPYTSYLGPKMKVHSLAPWELGEEEEHQNISEDLECQEVMISGDSDDLSIFGKKSPAREVMRRLGLVSSSSKVSSGSSTKQATATNSSRLMIRGKKSFETTGTRNTNNSSSHTLRALAEASMSSTTLSMGPSSSFSKHGEKLAIPTTDSCRSRTPTATSASYSDGTPFELRISSPMPCDNIPYKGSRSPSPSGSHVHSHTSSDFIQSGGRNVTRKASALTLVTSDEVLNNTSRVSRSTSATNSSSATSMSSNTLTSSTSTSYGKSDDSSSKLASFDAGNATRRVPMTLISLEEAQARVKARRRSSTVGILLNPGKGRTAAPGSIGTDASNMQFSQDADTKGRTRTSSAAGKVKHALSNMVPALSSVPPVPSLSDALNQHSLAPSPLPPQVTLPSGMLSPSAHGLSRETARSPRQNLHTGLSKRVPVPSLRIPYTGRMATRTASDSSGPVSATSLSPKGPPSSAPASMTQFPALSLRPVSTIFSNHFSEHLIQELGEAQALEASLLDASSAGTSASSLSPGPFTTRNNQRPMHNRPDLKEATREESDQAQSEDQSAVIGMLREQIKSSGMAWQRQIWELEGEIRDLKAEVEKLKYGGVCDACGRGILENQTDPSKGVIHRPRARTGTGGARFANGNT